MKFKFGILAAGILLSAVSLQAQKLGHINSAVVIESHPRVATANAELEDFQKSLAEPFEVKAKAFQEKYRKYLEDASGGVLSQVAMQAQQNELRAEQKTLAEEDQQIQFKVLQKREALLQPILSEVDSLIQMLGKEGQYTMIFDTSVSGALLFAMDSEDLTEVLKTKCAAIKP